MSPAHCQRAAISACPKFNERYHKRILRAKWCINAVVLAFNSPFDGPLLCSYRLSKSAPPKVVKSPSTAVLFSKDI
jgi:hypothetical protein